MSGRARSAGAGAGARPTESGPFEERPSHCLDCGEPLGGRFCARCGQRAAVPDPSLRSLVGQTLDDLFSLDSRAWVTLRRLITRPGFLTLEHWHGRRTRWVAPLRLYLLISFFAFLVLIPLERLELQVTDDARDSVEAGFFQLGIEGGTAEETAEILAALEEQAAESGPVGRFFLQRVVIPVVRDVPAAQAAYSRRLPAIAFALVPVLAFELFLAFRRRVRYYAQHLIAALHLQAFFFLALTATSLLGLVVAEGIAEILLLLLLFLYAYRALRTVYWEQSRFAVLTKMAILSLVHLLVIALALMTTLVAVGMSL